MLVILKNNYLKNNIFWSNKALMFRRIAVVKYKRTLYSKAKAFNDEKSGMAASTDM